MAVAQLSTSNVRLADGGSGQFRRAWIDAGDRRTSLQISLRSVRRFNSKCRLNRGRVILLAVLQRVFVLLAIEVAGLGTGFANAAEERLPVVLIPGILGSKICDGQTVIWGGLGSLQNFRKLDALSDGGRKLKTCGILKKIEILGPFWASDGYDGLLTQLSSMGYQDGNDLIVFDYDWRMSNFDTAKLLKEALEKNEKFRSGRFNIVAHSMGGIVTRILLQDHDVASRVGRIIYLGTPFNGSANALGTISDGWGTFANLVAGGMSTIRRTLLSFASLYELMPRYSNCCRFGAPENPSTLVMMPTLLDADLWRKYDWLPDEYRTGDRSAFFSQAIESAKGIKDVTDRPPVGINETMIVGTANETKLYLYVDRSDSSWRKWRFSVDKGDGTVPLWSASAGNLSEGSPAFAPHASIFEDKWVSERLKWLLTNPQPPPIKGPGAVIETIKHEQKSLDRVAVTVAPEVAPYGSPLTVTVKLIADDKIGKGEVAPDLVLDGQIRGKFAETTTDEDITNGILTFQVTTDRPSDAGAHRIDVQFGSSGRASKYFVVQP